MASPTLIRIADIAAHEGQQVLLQGWVQLRTGKGRLHFIRLRDGSGVVQCVAFRHELNEDDFCAGPQPDAGSRHSRDRRGAQRRARAGSARRL